MYKLLIIATVFCLSITIEIETFKQVIKTTFARNSSDLSFGLTQWVQFLQHISQSVTLNSHHIYQSFSSYDLNSNGRVTIDELLTKMDIIPTLKIGPKQIHIGLTGRDNEMQVMWITQPEKAFMPVVRYGVSPLNLNEITNATWNEYNAGHIGFHGRIYRAVMIGLKPGAKYFYTVGDSTTNVFSDMKSFKAPPTSRQHLDRINIAVFGDMGTIAPFGYSVSQQISRSNMVDPFDFVFLTGDVAYAGVSSQTSGQVEPIWDLFGQMIEKWAAYVPFMPGVGNHEKYYNYTAYTNRYYLPRSEGSGDNLWFSFDYAQLHVVHMSSEHDYNKGSPQYQFLEKDLARSSSNPNTKWIILGVHRPFYAASDKAYNENTGLAKALEELVNLYKVDIIQTGHMHCYERTWPIFRGKALKTGQNQTYYTKPGAPVYIVQGTAGALIHETWIDPLPEWSLVRTQKYGLGKIIITGNVLKYQFISTSGGKVLDEWHIIK